ncbi:MAG: hypothetical protein JXA96_17005 [Sedimentisphaerales bacterium]|nr:hypothetical protein [Sedimentisphaerales bacterium]
MNSRKRVMFFATLFIAALFSVISVAYAQDSASQKMVSMLPDDVLFFAETSGGDALKPDFEKTILGRIWNDPGVQSFYQQVEQSLMQNAQFESVMSEAPAYLKMAQSVVSLVGSRPIIIGAAQKQTQDGPPVYGFAIIDAGTKKDAISGILSNFEAMADEGEIVDVKIGSNTFHGPKDAGDVPAYWGWVGNYFVFAINDGDGLATKYLDSKTERQLPSYFQKSSITNDALAVYINFEKAFSLVKSIAHMEGEDEQIAIIETVMSKLGLDKMKSVTSRIGFSGSGVIADELINVSQPLTGLFATMKPVSLDTFNMVDSNAVTVSAVNVDVAGIYDTVFNAIKTAAGEDFAEVEQGIAKMEEQMQFKIRDGLLASLNGKMLFYQMPVDITSMQGGFVAVIGLKDVKLWNDSIAAIGKIATAMSNNMVQVSSQEMNGRTLNTIAIVPLALAQIMPTWTIVGENVVIGSSSAICIAAADQAAPAARAKSIRNNEIFQKATANLPSNILSFSYVDSKAQMTQAMRALQQIWPMATVFITQRTKISLPMVLPNLTNIIKDVTPSVQYSFIDEQGIHSIYKGAGIEPSLGAVAGAALGVGILMPALVRTRQIAFRMVTGTNLSGIGKSMLIYANDYYDEFPPNLEELAKKMDLNQKMLESRRKPANFKGPSFIYIPGQTVSDEPGNILVYENPEFCSDGVNVLFVDSHVEFMTKEQFKAKLKTTYDRLKRRNPSLKMPEIKFKN